MATTTPTTAVAEAAAADHAQDAARALLAQFQAVASIFDAIDVVIYVADLDTYELLFVNEHLAKLWGPGIGKRCYEVLQTGQTTRCPFCTNDRLVKDGKAMPPWVWEFQNTANKRWYLCIDRAIPWLDGRLVRMEVAIDITERKAVEQFRQQYVSLISHDLRSPLTALTVRAARVQKDLQRQGLAAEASALEAVLTNARRMAEMLSDLTETTQLEQSQVQLRKSRFELGQLAREVAARSGSVEDAKRITVHAEQPAEVEADPARTQQVLENLLGNALRYSPADGPIRITVERAAGEAVVSVEDRGVGIPKDELPKLFQRLYRASTARHIAGLGLGLYNSRLLVEAHGGRIWAESEVGAGSTFRVALPLAEP